jgi:hypothetical protein
MRGPSAPDSAPVKPITRHDRESEYTPVALTRVLRPIATQREHREVCGQRDDLSVKESQ